MCSLQIGHFLERSNIYFEEGTLITNSDGFKIGHLIQLVHVFREQDMLVEGVACAHFVSKDFTIELHCAATIEEDVHSSISFLPVAV